MAVTDTTEVLDFNVLRDSGLLWAINKLVLHPRGYAIGLEYTEDLQETVGWRLLGDGTEPWSFEEKTDKEGFKKLNAFLSDHSSDVVVDKKKAVDEIHKLLNLTVSAKPSVRLEVMDEIHQICHDSVGEKSDE